MQHGCMQPKTFLSSTMSSTEFQYKWDILQSFIRCKLWTNVAKNGQNEQFVFTGLYFTGNPVSCVYHGNQVTVVLFQIVF